jgi:uncharacterized RDD family membrane protein YckC
LSRRLAATGYEALLLTALLLLVGFALLPFLGQATGESPAQLDALSSPRRALSGAASFLVCSAYCIGLWSGGRRTLPMKTWRIVLRTADGAFVGLRRAALRYLAVWIGPALAICVYLALRPSAYDRWALLLLAFNYLWGWFDPDRQWLQDRIAGTRLLKDAPPRRGRDRS